MALQSLVAGSERQPVAESTLYSNTRVASENKVVSVLLVVPGRTRLHKVARRLVGTAMGREKADLVVRNAILVNVNTGELLEHTDVAVKLDRIALVGKADHTIGPQTVVIDAQGRYLAPGFIESHAHIESTMVSPPEFARAVLPWGTTTAFVDPHEIANVLGLRGVRLMLNASKKVFLKILVTVPSCIPASPGLETAGARFGPEEIKEALQWEGVAGLGEVMNYQSVVDGDPSMHGEIAATLRNGKVVEGHYMGEAGRELAAYAAAGITSCHESMDKRAATNKLRLGMYAQLREGSAWLDVGKTITAVTEGGIDSRHLCLVTDDVEPKSLAAHGHVNHVVQRAIQEGIDPVTAIQMASLNPAEHYEVARELGSLSPARFADMLLLSNLEEVKVDTVIANGVTVAREGKLLAEIPRPQFPRYAMNSIYLGPQITPAELKVDAEGKRGEAEVRVIEALEGSVLTNERRIALKVRDGSVLPSGNDDVVKLAVFERHHATGNVGLGFVTGFGLSEGAVGSTVAHDSHNLIVAGTSDLDMAFAVNQLASVGGGMIAVREKQILALVALELAGLMSVKPIEQVGQEVEHLSRAWQTLGCSWVAPYMTFSLLTLTAIPRLRLTDRGLVDAQNRRLVPLILN